jgi:hypothetical protein
MKSNLTAFQQKLRLRRYAENTIKTYSGCISKFLLAFERYNM